MQDFDSTDIMIGKIALAAGMVGDTKLQEVFSILKGSEDLKPVEDLLLDDGTLTAEQADVLRRIREDIRAGRGTGSAAFGQVAVDQGFITADQLKRAQVRQLELERRGQVRHLGEVMVEFGLITPHQIARILERQKRTPMVCAVCGKTYQVLPGTEERARCPVCVVRLAAPEEAEKAISPAEATAIFETVSAVAAEPAAAPKAERLTGQVIAGCKIKELIGKGSMASVYKARHLALGRIVAIKILPATGKGQLLMRRLLFEARSIAKLNHENIVAVYDAGMGKGHLFQVMEFVDGHPLDEHIAEAGQLMESQAIGVMQDVLKGLKAAHGAGIIHRDLKPANIMIAEGGRAKIMDFGLARDAEKSDDIEGMIIGTPYFMAPEQWLGRKADERSDLYALGFILYVMFTGHKPFESNTISELMHMHLKQAPPAPTIHRPVLNRGLVAILKKAMSKKPMNRYQNADDFAADLRRVTSGQDPEALSQYGKSVKCAFCEAINPEGSTRCSVCNESLQQSQKKLGFAQRKDEFRCPGCSEFVTQGTHACPHCQRAFCRRCSRRLAEDQGYCRPCLAAARNEAAARRR